MAENQKSSRDSHARWVKGVSGNPKGRPKKYSKIDMGQLDRFMHTVLEVNTAEGRTVMTREAAIQYRLYQSAMQGNVHAQIFLARRFEKFNETNQKNLAKVIDLLNQLKQEKRGMTLEESTFLAAAQKSMHAEPQPNEAQDLLKDWKRRLHRKRKRKDGGSDPGLKS